MAASKDPSSYPAAFAMLVAHFSGGDCSPVTNYYDRKESAEKMRFTFYNYKKALEKSHRKDELATANSMIAKIVLDDRGGAVLEFSLRDQQDFALDLEAAIIRAKESTPIPPQVPSEPLGKPIDHMEAYMERMYGDVASKNGVQTKGEGK